MLTELLQTLFLILFKFGPHAMVWCLSVLIAVRFCRRPFEGFLVAWLCAPLLGTISAMILQRYLEGPKPPPQSGGGMWVVLMCAGGLFFGPIPGIIAARIIRGRNKKLAVGSGVTETVPPG